MTDPLATALYYYLTVDATDVAAIVGTDVYPDGSLPRQQAPPYLVYRQVSGRHLNDAEGGIGEARTRVQIDGWCASASSHRALATALREALDNFVGAMGPAGEQLNIRHCGLVMDFDRLPVEAPGEEAGLVGFTNDFLFSHPESLTP